jgi:hypothetical protein
MPESLLLRIGLGLSIAAAALALPVNDTSGSVTVRWIGDTPEYSTGTTFGVPWPQGQVYLNDTSFAIAGGSGGDIPAQSWVTGYWRDGSVKWSAHAIPQLDAIQEEYAVKAVAGQAAKRSTFQRRNATGEVSVVESDEEIVVNTGKISASFAKEGSSIIKSIKTAAGKTVGKNGRLVLHSQSAIADDVASRTDTSVDYFNFESNIEEVSVSDDSHVRALVTVRGKFQATAGEHDSWLPFVVRFYLYSGSDSIRVIHSVVFDGDANSDFVAGLGIRLQVPLDGEELYNRHVRLAGVDGGFLNEAVQGITGLRRDPGENVRTAQYEGRETPDIGTWDTRVSSRMQWIPVWNDFSLRQLTADGFSLKKRTKPGQGWLDVASSSRSGGLAYLGGATKGGLAVGLRDFWKQYPAGLDVSNAGSDDGEITLWLYSPEAGPLDLRTYHDGMGQDTYAKQLDALEITYEDYEPGFDTPFGIAKTSELYIYAFDQTPTSEQLGLLNGHLNSPPVLYADPEYVRDTKALGSYWSLPDTSSDRAAAIENNLDFLNEYYQGQVEDRRWYGFLHYGDFMHSYDPTRHAWKYDIGGYAWDNSELSPDLFFWQYFLRTGREDVYRFAEALTRHTGEVDVYHLGKWKGLGTRHGVQHYVDSAKQVRIAQPQYRKYFYYLSGGDERVGELLDEALDTDQTYGILDPNRKVRTDGWVPEPGKPAAVSLGTDWAALAAGWLIGWERRGPRWQEARDKLRSTASGIANLTNGFVTGSGLYDNVTGTLTPPPLDPNNEGLVAISHLNAVFGMPEVISELLEYWGEDDTPEGFADAWLDYCYYYAATGAEQQARYGKAFSGVSLRQGHARLSAYFASQRDNDTVAARSWNQFFDSDGFSADQAWASEEVTGPGVLAPVQEAAWVTTNDVAQYGLAAIQGLALARDALDSYSDSR